MKISDAKKEINAIKEKQRRLLNEFEQLDKRVELLENFTQENKKGEVEVSDKMKLHIAKLNLRNGKVIPKHLM